MGSLKQRYEQFAEFMQHNTKGVEVIADCDTFIYIFLLSLVILHVDIYVYSMSVCLSVVDLTK